MDESNHQHAQNDGDYDVDQPTPAPLPQHPQEEEVAENGTAQQEYSHPWRFKRPLEKAFRALSRLRRWRRLPVNSLDNLDPWRPPKLSQRPSPQTISNFFLVLFTFGLIVTSYLQWQSLNEANSLVRESQKQTNHVITIMQQQFTAAERPWVRADIRLIRFLTFNEQGGSLSIRAKLKSTGHSPAENVRLILKIAPFINVTDVYSSQDTICNP